MQNATNTQTKEAAGTSKFLASLQLVIIKRNTESFSIKKALN